MAPNRVEIGRMIEHTNALSIYGRSAPPVAPIVKMGNGQTLGQVLPEVLIDEAVAYQTIAK